MDGDEHSVRTTEHCGDDGTPRYHQTIRPAFSVEAILAEYRRMIGKDLEGNGYDLIQVLT